MFNPIVMCEVSALQACYKVLSTDHNRAHFLKIVTTCRLHEETITGWFICADRQDIELCNSFYFLDRLSHCREFSLKPLQKVCMWRDTIIISIGFFTPHHIGHLESCDVTWTQPMECSQSQVGAATQSFGVLPCTSMLIWDQRGENSLLLRRETTSSTVFRGAKSQKSVWVCL